MRGDQNGISRELVEQAMKCPVGLIEYMTIVDGLPVGLERKRQVRHLGRCRGFCSRADKTSLYQDSCLEQVPDPASSFEQTLDDVSHRIDGRFIACTADDGTKSRSRLDQSSIGQRLDGFAHDSSTNIVSIHDFPFGRQGITFLELSAFDHVDEGLKQPVRGARRLPFDPLCDLAFGHRLFVFCLVIPKQTTARVTSAAWGGNG